MANASFLKQFGKIFVVTFSLYVNFQYELLFPSFSSPLPSFLLSEIAFLLK